MTALCIILGIILFFVLLLSVRVRADAEYIESFGLRVRWLFLRFTVFPRPPEQGKKPKKPKKKKPEKKKVETQGKPKKPNPFRTFYEDQGFEGVLRLLRDGVDAVGGMMKSIKKHLVIEELCLWMTVSQNSDAAATAIKYGQVCAEVFPALGFLCTNLSVKKYDAQVEPDFIGTSSDAQFAASISLRPLFLVNAALVLAFRLLFKVVLKLLRRKPKKAADAGKNKNTEIQNIQGGVSE